MRATPVPPITMAGMRAHRRGWLVKRVVSRSSIAQPTAKATRARPVVVCSRAPGNTTSVRTAAETAPVRREARTTRNMGPVLAPSSSAAGSCGVVSVAVVVMANLLSTVEGWELCTPTARFAPVQWPGLALLGPPRCDPRLCGRTGLRRDIEVDDSRCLVQSKSVVQAAERRRRPPVPVTQQCHGRGDEQAPDDGRVDGDGDRQCEAHLLDSQRLPGREPEEHDEYKRRSGRDDPP